MRERNVGDCQRCPLARTRRNIVFGVGNPEADLMFIGEAPGGEEDRLGEPFVGPAGRRLDAWLDLLGLRRADVYIANVLKCRPPGNRDPQPMEIERCSPFLHAQIRAIEPKVIVALGRYAGCLLLQRDLKLYEMRRSVQQYREPKSGAEIPLMVTYHPSYVLRQDRRGHPGHRGGGPPPQSNRPAWINPEDEKVLADLERALALLRR
ncbi:uracil-DNA glycosylase [Pseudenhygromyxa sp. WMMC2535]|nr:uracil-DNA glycosylase [Pseudenhygromyxa sp. WMMC2535]NVB41652.1 uracil-DNA glycosylase [Pseudenhygromyxa sp. WMMC2535]